MRFKGNIKKIQLYSILWLLASLSVGLLNAANKHIDKKFRQSLPLISRTPEETVIIHGLHLLIAKRSYSPAQDDISQLRTLIAKIPHYECIENELFKCTQSKKKTAHGLKCHVRRYHLTIAQSEKNEIKTTPYKCFFCSKIYDYISTLVEHSRTCFWNRTIISISPNLPDSFINTNIESNNQSSVSNESEETYSLQESLEQFLTDLRNDPERRLILKKLPILTD